MNTMNLVTNTPTITPAHIAATRRTADLTTLDSQELQAWFAKAGLAVTEVAHCASASCPVCFGNVSLPARAA